MPAPVILTAKDPEGYALVYEITSQPAHGTLSGAAPNLTYLSGLQFTGSDSFSYRVTSCVLKSCVFHSLVGPIVPPSTNSASE